MSRASWVSVGPDFRNQSAEALGSAFDVADSQTRRAAMSTMGHGPWGMSPEPCSLHSAVCRDTGAGPQATITKHDWALGIGLRLTNYDSDSVLSSVSVLTLTNVQRLTG